MIDPVRNVVIFGYEYSGGSLLFWYYWVLNFPGDFRLDLFIRHSRAPCLSRMVVKRYSVSLF